MGPACMMMLEYLNVEILSRVQFAFVVAFHILFPSFTIGLASFLMFLEAMWMKTKKDIYMEVYRFLLKIFTVTFGLGVVTGVVMSYQFGTNWAGFMAKVSNVLGPLLGYEVLVAFFLEATFLGIMIFGWKKVSPKVHFFSTCMVAIGTAVSAFWILSANSWMHTPAGYVIKDGIFHPADWMKIIFNPSFWPRFTHMMLAAYITTAFVVNGIAAYFLIKNKFVEHAKVIMKMSMGILIVLVPLQIFVGDHHGLNTLQHQPQKIAAIEGIWETEKGAPLTVIGWPDEKEMKTHFAIEIPKLASIILTHSMDGKVRGLKSWPKDERPPVALVFFSFRVMVMIGFMMLGTILLGVYLMWRKKIFSCMLFQKLCLFMSPMGFVAVLAGWIVTEVGRQPYIVYGLLRTSDTLSAVNAPQVLFSLLLFFVTYMLVTTAGIYYVFKTIRKGI